MTNVPFASSTRSRIEASPTRPCRRNSRVIALSNPRPSSSTSTRSDVAVVSTETDDAAGARVLRGVRQRFLHHPIGERLEIGGQRARERAREIGLDALLDPEARHRLPERGHQPALLEHRRTQSRHQGAERVGLVGELLAHLREHVDASIDVARADHQERGFEGERRGRDPLHRPVVEVARDPVPLGLDRGVRPAEQAGAVLVLLLEELQQRPDRLVGGLARRDVSDQHEPPRRIGGDLGHARLEVQGRAVRALELGLPGGGEVGEPRVGAVERRRQRLPALPLDRGRSRCTI